MAMREARYSSRPGWPVEGIKGAGCWAKAADESASAANISVAMVRLILIRILPTSLHPVVIRPPAAFGGHPGDDLVGVGDVAGLAVDAVARVQADAFAIRLTRVVDHFIDVGGTEILAGAAEFLYTARVADVGIVDNQVRGL